MSSLNEKSDHQPLSVNFRPKIAFRAQNTKHPAKFQKAFKAASPRRPHSFRAQVQIDLPDLIFLIFSPLEPKPPILRLFKFFVKLSIFVVVFSSFWLFFRSFFVFSLFLNTSAVCLAVRVFNKILEDFFLCSIFVIFFRIKN